MRGADIAVYDRKYSLQLVGEVQGRLRASEEWIRQLREYLLETQVIPRAPYFLLALPDKFYLWTPGTSGDPQAPPDYRIDAQQALAHYMRGWENALERIYPSSLEMLVSSWLQDLASLDRRREEVPDSDWLFDSGLYDAIRGGRVDIDVAV